MTQVHTLTTVLVGGHTCNNLRHLSACDSERMRRLNHFPVHHGAVLQHIADVNQAAVEDRLDEVVCIMEVNGTLVVGLGNVLGQQLTPGQVPTRQASDIITLGGGEHRILVGVLLRHFLVLSLHQAKDISVQGGRNGAPN